MSRSRQELLAVATDESQPDEARRAALQQYVGQQVRSARECAGLSRIELATRMKMKSPHQLYMVEAGNTGISLERLFLLASALGIQACDLLDPSVEFEKT